MISFEASLRIRDAMSVSQGQEWAGLRTADLAELLDALRDHAADKAVLQDRIAKADEACKLAVQEMSAYARRCGELEAQLCAQLVEHPGRKALLLVLAELRKAKAKHPHFADDLGQACTVLLSEAGGLATAVLRAQAFGPHGAMEEAAQVAAVCLRLIEMLQGREVANAS